MSNKFLYPLHDESLAVLQNGTATLFLKSLKVNDLQSGKNVATDSGKYLTSDSSGGGGVVTTNKPVEDNSIVIYDGTTGDNIKYISGLKYDDVNTRVVVPDLESGIYLSLNDRLQKISNIQSATQSPDIVTNFNGEIHVAKIKSASHNTELEFETDGDVKLTTDNNINLTAGVTGDIALNSNSLTYNGDNVKFLVEDGANLFGGNSSGINLTTGINNTAVGYLSMKDLTTGKFNATFGANAGEKITDGDSNTFVGSSAGLLLTTGDNNTGIGAGSSAYNATGNNNTSIGVNSLFSNTAGIDNTAIGYNCLYFGSGSSNTAIGKACMYNNTIGSANTAIGQGSLSENLNGSDNTFIGRDSGGVGTSIQQCVGIGSESGRQNTFNCVSIGWAAARDSTGDYNTAIGAECLKSSSGDSNVSVGKQSLLNNTSGRENTAIGANAGQSNTTGEKNTCIGGYSGTFNQTGSYNTFIGDGTSVSFGTNPSNSTCIGFGAEITASNQIVLGNNTIIGIVSGSNGLCDLGSSSKKFKDLYVAGDIYGSTPYDFSFACTDEVNTITSTGQKMYIRAPRDFNVQKFKVSLNAVAGPGFALNIKNNGSNMINTVILGTTITTISPATAVSVLENDEITVEVTNIGSGTGVGLKVYLIGKT